MKIQLIRNATLRVHYAGKLFLIDPDLADKHARDPLAGQSRNPTVDLPIPSSEVVDGIEMVLVSHLHQDHFDSVAQELLPKDLALFCQPEDETKIREFGFNNVRPVDQSTDWEGITITRTAAQHGSGVWAERLAPVSGFLIEAKDEPTVYWAGDTIYYAPIKAIIDDAKPEIIITHSGGAQLGESGPIVMDVEQTLDLCKDAPHARVVAVHLEALDHCLVARADLAAATQEAGFMERVFIPVDGETISL